MQHNVDLRSDKRGMDIVCILQSKNKKENVHPSQFEALFAHSQNQLVEQSVYLNSSFGQMMRFVISHDKM